jgi:hypothetical protein
MLRSGSAIVFAVGLAACTGGHSGASAAAFGRGAFVLQLRGATITVQAPAPATDALVSEVESYRARTGQPAVAYVLVTIDNTKGSTRKVVDSVTVVSPSGARLEFGDALVAVADWAQAAGDTTIVGANVYNSLLNRDAARPGNKTVNLMTGPVTGPDGALSVKSVFIDGQALKPA